MAGYRVFIKPSAAKEIEAVDPKSDRRRIGDRILGLAAEPLPSGCEKLAGERDLYRVRVGRFRILYSIADEELIVLVVRVRHRRDICR